METVEPAERAEPKIRSLSTGKLRCSRQPTTSLPTAPVACVGFGSYGGVGRVNFGDLEGSITVDVVHMRVVRGWRIDGLYAKMVV